MTKNKKNNPFRNAPEEIDQYLACLPEDSRTTLQKLREIIKEVVPGVTERISYKIPIFRLKRDLVGFASHKNYLSFYTMSFSLVQKMKDELRGFKVSVTTIHFTPEYPLSRELIEKTIKARMDEMDK